MLLVLQYVRSISREAALIFHISGAMHKFAHQQIFKFM